MNIRCNFLSSLDPDYFLYLRPILVPPGSLYTKFDNYFVKK